MFEPVILLESTRICNAGRRIHVETVADRPTYYGQEGRNYIHKIIDTPSGRTRIASTGQIKHQVCESRLPCHPQVVLYHNSMGYSEVYACVPTQDDCCTQNTDGYLPVVCTMYTATHETRGYILVVSDIQGRPCVALWSIPIHHQKKIGENYTLTLEAPKSHNFTTPRSSMRILPPLMSR